MAIDSNIGPSKTLFRRNQRRHARPLRCAHVRTLALESLEKRTVLSATFEWVNTPVESGVGYGLTVDASGDVYACRQGFDASGRETMALEKTHADGSLAWHRELGRFGRLGQVALGPEGQLYAAAWEGPAIPYGYGEIFVARLDPADGHEIWSITTGSARVDGALDVAVDALGDVYVAGFFRDTVDFGAGYTLTADGYDGNGFLWKLDETGITQWAHRAASGLGNVAIDAAGRVYVGGTITNGPGTTFTGRSGDIQLAALGGYFDPALACYTADGDVLWAKNWGGPGDWECVSGLEVDAHGDLLVSTDFETPITLDPNDHSAFPVVSPTYKANAISKLNRDGDLIWGSQATLIPGDGGNEQGRFYYGNLVLDSAGNVYCQTISGVGWPPPDARVTKFSVDGDVLWTEKIAGTSAGVRVDPLGMAVDQHGGIYLSGNFNGPVDFDPGAGVELRTASGLHPYLLKLREVVPEPPSFIVTTDQDGVDRYDGLTSLREAIAYANSHVGEDEITFALGPGPHTIVLTDGEMAFTDLAKTTITGADDPGQLVIDAHQASRIFRIDAGAAASIAGMTLTNGLYLEAVDGGGAIQNFGVLWVDGCSFTNNLAHGGGGAINNDWAATLTVTNCYFADNSATYAGGAISNNFYTTVSVSNSAFYRNSTGSMEYGYQTGWGGAIYINYCVRLYVSSSIFAENAAAVGGGAIDNNLGELHVANSTLAGNYTTFANSPEYGGGAIRSNAPMTIANSTVAVNHTAADGGGILLWGGSAVLNNTIVAGNLAGDDSTPSDIQGVVEAANCRNNLVGDGSGGLDPARNNLLGVDPRLGPLGDYGGATEVMPLLPGSPAINAGSNALAVDAGGQPLLFDQRGELFARIADGTVDIGAFEYMNHVPALSGVPSEVTIPELDAYSFTAVATDEDLPPQSLVFSLIDEPEGAAIDPATGVFTWTPSEAQGPGDYAFTVRVSDGEAYGEAAIAIHVTEANAPPVAESFAVNLTGGCMTIPVLLHAADPDGDALALVEVTPGANGSVVVNPDGTVSYTLTRFVSTTDQFAYTVSDGHGGTATGLVTVQLEVPAGVVFALIENHVENLDLSRGHEKLLMTGLRNAEKFVDRGFTSLATLQLRLFTLHVRVLEAVDWIDDADADLLVDEVEALIDLLE